MIPSPPTLSLWMLFELVANHLWQSTVFLAAAALLALALKGAPARVRYRLWLAASVKFLVPLAGLVALGEHFSWRPSTTLVERELTLAVDAISQPFSQPGLRGATASLAPTSSSVGPGLAWFALSVWSSGCAAIVAIWWARARRLARTVRAAVPITEGLEIDALRRLESRCGTQLRLAILSSDTRLEPGVFGIVKPVLLWPRGIAGRLNDDEIEALLAHELSHIRRRDNFTASLHMVVEAVFWFHPLVWWLGARLIDERERACDEDVVGSGTPPEVYAESILRTCRYCLESPLACVAGISGAHLTRRIERIMADRPTQPVSLWRRAVLATAGVVAIAGPIAFGAVSTTQRDARRSAGETEHLAFAVASITPTPPGSPFYPVQITPEGRFAWKNVGLQQVIDSAYREQQFRQIVGMPTWSRSERFDFEARAAGSATKEQIWSMVRRLLADRFALTTHVETREVPIYALVKARSDGALGPGIRPSACAAADKVSIPPGPVDRNRPPMPPPCGGVRGTKGTLQARFAPMAKVAGMLSMLIGRPVEDRTALTGVFDLEVEWTPAADSVPPFAPGIGEPTFAAIEEQLGLRLEPQIGPVRMLVIDHIEHPVPEKPQ